MAIRALESADIPEAAALCAWAMRDNPIHKLCFGRHAARRQRRLRRFFTALLAYSLRRGMLFGAFEAGRLVGIVGALAPGACRPRWHDVLRMAPRVLLSNTPLGLWRTSRWLLAWLQADPDHPHWHLGPLAVAPNRQGLGLAQRLGRQLLAATAHEPAASLYLETDRWRNVRLYRHFGFRVSGRRQILGFDSWLLRRDNHGL